MIRKVRRRLRLIHYYSAARPRTMWVRAMEWMLVLSLLLAIPAQFVGETIFVKQTSAETLHGVVLGHLDGPQTVEFQAEPGLGWGTDGIPDGTFSIGYVVQNEGWPAISRSAQTSAMLTLNLYAEVEERPPATYDEMDPVHVLIHRAMRSPDRNAIRESWIAQESAPGTRRYLATVIGVAAWWVFLMVFGAICIGVARLLHLRWLVLSHKRMEARFRKNLCVSCGYSLEGLEFAERCPECGEMVDYL